SHEGLRVGAVLLQRPRELFPRIRRRAQAESFHCGRRETALAQVPPNGLPSRGGELAAEESGRAFGRVVERILAGVALPADLDLDARTLAEHTQGLGKADPVVLHDERERVTALVTAEAVKHLPLGMDHEARGLLGVERAEAFEAAARAFQIHVLA